MAKYARGRNRRNRAWYRNVGDPIDLAKKGVENPNDKGLKFTGTKKAR